MRWTQALPTAMFAALAGCAGLGQLGAVNPSERADVRNACEAKARSDHLDIQSWRGIREVSPDHFEVPLTVNHLGQQYDRVCVYDDRNRSVDIREGSGSYGGFGNGGNGGYGGWGGGGGWGGDATGERAQVHDACEAKARSDSLRIVSWGPMREVSSDHWEAALRVEWKGNIYDRTCLYDVRGRDVKIVDR